MKTGQRGLCSRTKFLARYYTKHFIALGFLVKKYKLGNNLIISFLLLIRFFLLVISFFGIKEMGGGTVPHARGGHEEGDQM